MDFTLDNHDYTLLQNCLMQMEGYYKKHNFDNGIFDIQELRQKLFAQKEDWLRINTTVTLD